MPVREQEGTLEDEMFLDDEEDTQTNKYLLFSMDDELYGIAISSVTEIIEMQKITPVPDMPGFVKGVINLRGKVIPITDLRLRFGMEERVHDDRTCTIIVTIDEMMMGFIVDTVAEVQDIFASDIDPPPNFDAAEKENQFISGLGKVGEKVTILIDVAKILKKEDLEVIADGVE